MNVFEWNKLTDGYWVVEAATDRHPVVAYIHMVSGSGRWLGAICRAFDYYDDDLRLRAALASNATFDTITDGKRDKVKKEIEEELLSLKCRFVSRRLAAMT